MALGKRLINTGAAAAACLTETTDIFGDSSGVALYSLDYDASTAPDGTDYSGTPTNVDFGVDGQINYGARFNGSSSIIKDVLGSGFTYASKTMTFSAWIFVTDNTNDNVIIGDGFTTSQGGWAIATGYGSAPNQRLSFSVASSAMGGVQQTYSSVSIADDTWTHIAVSVNFSSVTDSIKMYINGTEDTSLTDGISGSFVENTTYNSSIGGTWTGSAARLFEGSIDQVRIFSKALNQTEVDTLYAETACVYTSTTDIVNYPTGTTPIAYYKLDNSSEDYSTGGNDGTDTNVEYRFGRFGQAASFDGSGDSIQINGFSGFTNYNFTLSIWIKTTDTQGYITSFRDPMYITFILGGYSGGTTGMGIYDGTNQYFINNTAMQGINDGNWHHIVMTHDGTNLKGYINGFIIDTVSTGTTTQSSGGTNHNRIGMRGDGNSSSFDYNGLIDQVRIYDAALTDSQVTELYNEKPEVDTSNFKTVLYEGNGDTTNPTYISNVGMDLETNGGLVWVKSRSTTYNHLLMDSVRGTTSLTSNDTTAERTNLNRFQSYEANGFMILANNAADLYKINRVSQDFVAWVFKGGGDAVSNTDGSITSQVSVNTDAGFSIVKYSGNTGADQTVGHGLSSTPEMVIVKRLTDSGYSWCVQHTGLTSMGYNIYLDDNREELLRNRITAWNSTTFTVEQIHETNNTGKDYIAYCFHSVSGYSKIGSYSGTSSTGNRIYVDSNEDGTGTGGFEPSFVMLKKTNGTGSWFIYDNRRGSANYLRPDLSNSEGTDGGVVFTSDGFTINVTYSDHNISGGTYLYMAFK